MLLTTLSLIISLLHLAAQSVMEDVLRKMRRRRRSGWARFYKLIPPEITAKRRHCGELRLRPFLESQIELFLPAVR
jgi:hypothetical protein